MTKGTGRIDFCRLLRAGAGPRSLVLLEKCKQEQELVSGNMMLCPERRRLDRASVSVSGNKLTKMGKRKNVLCLCKFYGLSPVRGVSCLLHNLVALHLACYMIAYSEQITPNNIHNGECIMNSLK